MMKHFLYTAYVKVRNFSASGVTTGRAVVHTKTGIATKQRLSVEVSFSHVVTGAQCGLLW
jgi:hypothetical protein